MESESEIFNHLIQLGCCKLCALRYLCNKSIDFSKVDSYLQQYRPYKDQMQNGNDHIEGTDSKKIKANPCMVCLGLLQPESLTQIIQSDKLLKAKEYDSSVFTCSISMPASILVRERSMRIYLENKFPSFYEGNIEIPLNRVWKVFVRDELSKCLSKDFENSDVCNFSINVAMDYPKDIEELDNLMKMQPKMYAERSTQRKKYNCELFSRKGVVTALSQTVSGVFKENYPVPPDIPNEYLGVKNIECKHNSVYLAGKYLKFSRELSQSPWIIDGVKAMETSVQEIIFGGIRSVFGILENNLKFSSSGREDCDVRCLGKGRPFYIEILDPTKTKFSFEEFRELEKTVNKSELIKVLHLQSVERSELVNIKEGEESKTKDYSALCILKELVTQEQIEKINGYGEVKVLQKTPIRVLHRRPLAVRTKMIYQMKAKLIEGKPNLIELQLNTQAGTYVKEFVHGDFGRTTPNLGEIMGSEVDIIALDVTAINLDWPEEVNYENQNLT